MALDNYEGFKADILRKTKIDLSAYKEKQMRRRIDSLAVKHKCNSYEEYIKLMDKEHEVFDEFINFMTINVSEFYRNPEQWDYLDKEFIPELIKRFGKNLKIWSAACSTGDEPYSLVMALSRHLPLNQIKIMATDLDNEVMRQAKVGLYNDKSIAGVPADLKKKYFTQVGKSWQISDEIKSRVEFKQHNLLKDPYPKGCDMIVCRNVLIYFTEEAKYEVYQKFEEALKEKGILFIGSTEQVTDYKKIGYKRRYSFFYQKDAETKAAANK